MFKHVNFKRDIKERGGGFDKNSTRVNNNVTFNLQNKSYRGARETVEQEDDI